MSELAGLIGVILQSLSDWFAPNGWSRRRALIFLFLALCLSVTLFWIAWPDGLPS